MTDDGEKKVIALDEHRWIEVGSPEWQHEVMSAINELIDRVSYLEYRQGLFWDRIRGQYIQAVQLDQ